MQVEETLTNNCLKFVTSKHQKPTSGSLTQISKSVRGGGGPSLQAYILKFPLPFTTARGEIN